MTYTAKRNNGGVTESFTNRDDALVWVADGIEFEEVENGEGSVYVFPVGSKDNNDCLGEVITDGCDIVAAIGNAWGANIPKAFLEGMSDAMEKKGVSADDLAEILKTTK